MVKKRLQDVVPSRSIRDIPVAGKRASALHHEKTAHIRERDQLIEKLERRESKHRSIMDDDADLNDFDDRYSDPAQQHFTKWGFWIISVMAVIFFVFSIILFFAGATVTINPKQQNVSVDKALSAKPDVTTSGNTLTYQVLTLTKQQTTTMPVSTSSKSTIDQLASGKITVFNNFSPSPAILIKNTRFESANGLIYRIRDAIRVPGYTVKNGVITAGTIDVTVYADLPGSSYNLSGANFTIPGFKSDATRYSKIFAQSKTDIAGGIAKNEAGISVSDKDAATEQLKATLKDALLKDIQSQKPADSVLYDGAYTIDYSTTVDAQKNTNTVALTEKGTISAVILNKKSLSRVLLGDKIAAVGGDAEVRGMEDLIFTATQTASSSVRLTQQNPLTFNLKGPLVIVGVVDSTKIQADLAGKPKTDLQKLLTSYPTIDTVNATIRPFWKNVFPVDASKITIKIEQK